MNRRSFIITLGAILALAMLATSYAAVSAYSAGARPPIEEDYREAVLTDTGENPFLRAGQDFAAAFAELFPAY